MFTWINRAASVAALMALAACVPGLPDLATSSSRAVPVFDGAVQVKPAVGYCVDSSASRQSSTQAVIIMGRCSAQSATLAAVVTVSIADAGSAAGLSSGPRELASYFQSEAGRAALSRDGQAASVTLRDVMLNNGHVIVHLAERDTGDSWRAFLGLRGRLVSVSVMAANDASDPDATRARTLLDRSVSAMISANGGR
jgi:hypothetical protein